MKFCKDCKHCSINVFRNDGRHPTCLAPVYKNPVNADPLRVSCDASRRKKLEHYSKWGYQPCGPDAQYFEAKS